MAAESFSVPVGSNIIPFDLPATDGKNYSVESFKESKALVVVFSCNHCPYAKAAWPLLIKMADGFKNEDVAFVAINPNDENQYPEDSFEEMKKKVPEWNINFPYLRDENQETAQQYGIMSIPTFLIFKAGKVVEQMIGVPTEDGLIAKLESYIN